MTTYVDSSVLLRPLLGQAGPMDLSLLVPAVTGRLTRVEVVRTLDRWRVRGILSEAEYLGRRRIAHEILRGFALVEVEREILDRAEDGMPLPLGTLDSLHLVTALRWRECSGPIRFATHDRALADAARAYGFEVVGA